MCRKIGLVYPIFEIKATEDKTKISTPTFSGSGKKILSFSSMGAIASPNSSSGRFTAYSSTSGSGGFTFVSSTGGSELEASTKF